MSQNLLDEFIVDFDINSENVPKKSNASKTEDEKELKKKWLEWVKNNQSITPQIERNIK